MKKASGRSRIGVSKFFIERGDCRDRRRRFCRMRHDVAQVQDSTLHFLYQSRDSKESSPQRGVALQ